MALTLRIPKGSALTHQEADNNFSGLADGSNWVSSLTTPVSLFVSSLTLSTLVTDRAVYSNAGQLSTFPGFNFFASTGRLDVSSLTVSTGNLTVSAGQVLVPTGSTADPSYSFTLDPDTGFYRSGANNFAISVGNNAIVSAALNGSQLEFALNSGTSFGWAAPGFASFDLKLFRDAANTLAQRNGTNAQTFRIYGNFSAGGSTFASIFHNATDGGVSTSTGSFRIQPQTASTFIPGSLTVSSQFGNIMSSTYTPTLSSIANLDGATTFLAQYMRIQDVVTVSGKVQIDPTAPATATRLGFTLPVASAFTQEEDCGGNAFASGIAGQGAAIRAEATNDQAEMVFISGDLTVQPMYYTYTYRIK